MRAAAAWFESRRERGSGNFWDAALLALEDPDVDTLWVLTDGVPTGGPRFCLELLVPLFVELNATRGVTIDTLLFGASGRVADHWRELAERTGGRLREVQLRPRAPLRDDG